jgi:hypothetical protein
MSGKTLIIIKRPEKKYHTLLYVSIQLKSVLTLSQFSSRVEKHITKTRRIGNRKHQKLSSR